MGNPISLPALRISVTETSVYLFERCFLYLHNPCIKGPLTNRFWNAQGHGDVCLKPTHPPPKNVTLKIAKILFREIL